MTRDPRARWNDREPEDDALEAFFKRSSADPSAAMDCPPPEHIQAARMELLPPAAQEAVARHLAGCAVCNALGDALDDPSIGLLGKDDQARLHARLRTTLTQGGRSSHARTAWRWPAIAAAVLTIAVTAVLFRQLQPSSTRDLPSALQLQKPTAGINPDSDLLWRGSGGSERADLAHALEPYEQDDFAEAARRLKNVVARHPQSVVGHLHLGVCLLFLRQPESAVSALERAERLAVNQPELAADANWYLALAFHALGQNKRSVEKLETVCRTQTARAPSACAGVRELSPGSPTTRPN